MNVYHSQQKLRVPGACKGDGDVRVLELGDRQHARFCLAQVYDAEGRSVEAFPAEVSRSVGAACQAPPEWDEVAPVLDAAGFGNPRYRGRRESSLTFQCDCLGVSCPCCPNVHDSQNWWVMAQPDGSLKVKNYSEHCRVMTLGEPEQAGPMFVEEVGSVACELPHLQKILVTLFGEVPQECHGHDPGMRECRHVIQHLQSCPTCAQHHQEPLWYIYEPIRSIFSMRNAAFSCSERLMTPFANTFMENLVTNCTSDRDYADLFISEHEDVYTSDGAVILKFDRRWAPVNDQDMQNIVQDWLTKVMRQLFVLMGHEENMRKLLKETMPKELKAYRDMYRATEKYLGKEGNMKSLLTTIKRKLRKNGLWENMDADPFVLGLDNGILLLRDGVFRAATQKDLVSKSVGYDWVETVDPEIEAQVEEFFCQLYPIEEERLLAQLWAGYCCTGSHPEKKFLQVTDVSGGWNGKSTFLKAIAATLGPDYSMQGTNAFLYKTDSHNETANSHTAGLNAHKGKRIVTYEELDAKRQLDCGLLKNLNGSRARVQGRACHATAIEEFEWTAKMVLAYNANCMPGFDFTDTALISRMLVLHHRSKFCETEEQMQQEPSPHVFLADPNLDNKLQTWRPYILRFFLRGCAAYFRDGFTKIPDACSSWRDDLVKQHDTVKAFVEDHLEHTGRHEDHIERSSLYEAYKGSYAEEKNKKTALGKRKWFEQLKVHLGDEHYHANPRLDGGRRPRDVWFQWRMTN